MKSSHQAITLITLSSVPFIMVLGNSMLIPVLPTIKNALQLSQFKVSLLITLFSIPAGLIIPIAGLLSDKYGRKKIITPSLILYGLGGVLAGLAAIFLEKVTYPLILAGRVIQGIGAAGTAPIAMAFCGDLFAGKERTRSLGILESANGFGKVVSPILGALVGLVTWYAVFLFFPLLAIPAALGVWFLIKEPSVNRAMQSTGEYLRSFAGIFEKKSVMLLTSFLGGMVALLILFGILFFLSEHLEKVFRFNGLCKGAALAIPVLFMSVTSYTTGALVKKKTRLMKWLVVTGLGLIAASCAVMGIYQQTFFFFILISLAGIGTGLTLPCLNIIITSSTSSERRGLVTSLYGSVRFFGVALGPPLFGLLMDVNLSLMFWTAAGLSALAFLLSIFFIQNKEITLTEEENETNEKPLWSPVPAQKPAEK